jgi:hypothetical protein
MALSDSGSGAGLKDGSGAGLKEKEKKARQKHFLQALP